MRPIRVGLDFDGVVAYNPLRIFRALIVLVKKTLGVIDRRIFYIPKTPVERLAFQIPHACSFFPAIGTTLLRELIASDTIEAHLVSGRYGYLGHAMETWLTRHQLTPLFASIHINTADEQPHRYKKKLVRTLRLDYYIEDNLDIVEYLVPRVTTKILWIYNVLDRFHPYPHKYPYLRRALEAIIRAEQASGIWRK